MNEEQIARKKQYAGEKRVSMKRRDDHHDYTERRMYMITLEVEGRRPLFGRLVGNPFAERGSCDESRIELTELGEAVQREWMGIHDYYPQIEVKAVQMMLVSPAISSGEKLVMRAAFDEGLLTIVLVENGFTPLTKPKGEQFDACAEGRLLLLAPWEHHNEKRTITASQCQQLNLMAIEICNSKVKEEEVGHRG